MRTNSRQLAIVACSFSPFDLLAVGPIDSIRFHALCRGKRRFARVRSAVRAVQAVIDSVGLAIWTVFAACRDTVMAGAGYVTSKTKAGYDHTRDGVSFVGSDLAGRVSQAWERVAQVGRVTWMFVKLYGLLGVSRKAMVPLGWTMIAADVTAPEPVVEREPESVVVEPTPVVALAHSPLPMPSAARLTQEDETTDEDHKALVRFVQVEKAKALLEGGMSRRAVARKLGVAESSLRRWLAK